MTAIAHLALLYSALLPVLSVSEEADNLYRKSSKDFISKAQPTEAIFHVQFLERQLSVVTRDVNTQGSDLFPVYHSGLGFESSDGHVLVVEFRPDNSNQLVSFLGPNLDTAVKELNSSINLGKRTLLSPVASLLGQDAARWASGGMSSFQRPHEYVWENPGSVHISDFSMAAFNDTDWERNITLGVVDGAVVNAMAHWAINYYNTTYTMFQPMGVPTTRAINARACHDFTEAALERLAEVHAFELNLEAGSQSPPLRDLLVLHAHVTERLGTAEDIGNSDAESMLQYFLELWGFMTRTSDVSLLHFYFYLSNNATIVPLFDPHTRARLPESGRVMFVLSEGSFYRVLLKPPFLDFCYLAMHTPSAKARDRVPFAEAEKVCSIETLMARNPELAMAIGYIPGNSTKGAIPEDKPVKEPACESDEEECAAPLGSKMSNNVVSEGKDLGDRSLTIEEQMLLKRRQRTDERNRKLQQLGEFERC